MFLILSYRVFLTRNTGVNPATIGIESYYYLYLWRMFFWW